jgi:hypothetical protein
MLTPNSWQGKHGIAPNDCNRADNPIHSWFVSTFSEQNFDGRPQLYGLHNLNRQKLIPSRRNQAQLLYSTSWLSVGAGYSTNLTFSSGTCQCHASAIYSTQAAGLATAQANNAVGYDSLSAHILQAQTTAQDTSNVCKGRVVWLVIISPKSNFVWIGGHFEMHGMTLFPFQIFKQ